MKKKLIKNLAQSLAQDNKIDTKVIDFILNKLNKDELKFFLNQYKIALDRKRVIVTASSKLTKEMLDTIKSNYKKYIVEVEYDEKLGAGIKIKQNDMIVDFTLKKYIDDTINKLK